VWRRLGTAERFYWLFDEVSCTNFVVVAELDGVLDSGTLEAGLAGLCSRHPRLRTRIVVDAQGQVVFESGAAPEIPILRTEGEPARWQREARRQLDLRFEPSACPPVRCVWIDGADRHALLMTFHHALTDARSAALLVEEMLLGRESEVESEALPPQEALHPPRFRGLWARARWIWRRFVEGVGKVLRGGIEPLPGRTAAVSTQRDPVIRTVRMSREQTTALLGRCRREGTTVQGALCAAQLLATAAEFPDSAVRLHRISSAVSLRRRLCRPVGESDPGMFISVIHTDHRVGSASRPWDLAREVVAQLRARLDRGDAHMLWQAFPPAWFFPPHERGAQRLSRLVAADPVGHIVTNLGDLGAGDSDGAVQLQSIHFVMAPHPGCDLVTCAATYRGRLVVNGVFDGATMPSDLQERFIGHVVGVLGGDGSRDSQAVNHDRPRVYS